MTTMTAAPTAPSVRARQNSRVAASQRATAPGGAASTASGTGTRAMAMGCWQVRGAPRLRRGASERWGVWGGGVGGARRAPPTTLDVSPVPDTRVDPRVADVHQEVHDDEHAGHEHDQRLDERVVTVRDRLHEEQPEAVEVEHLLGDDEAADEERELEGDHGEHGQHRVLERVPREDV